MRNERNKILSKKQRKKAFYLRVGINDNILHFVSLQMDRYYLQSVLRKRYRGCEVISLK